MCDCDKEQKMSEQPSPFSDDVQPVDAEPLPDHEGGTTSGDRPYRRRSGPLWGGLILVLVGVVLLLQNAGLDLPILQNWWAFFILIPAFSAFRRAQAAYRRSGNRVTRAVIGSLLGALALVLVTVSFLFGLSWSLILPIILILAGLGALITALAQM
jgi:hypothetical protein